MSSLFRPRLPLSSLVFMSLLVPPLAAQEKTEPSIGLFRVQTMPPVTYVHGSFETDFASMVKPLQQTLGAIGKHAETGKVKIRGPVMHVYFGSPHLGPDKKFRMETGFPVVDGGEGAGDVKVRRTEKFKCATMIYVGPGPRIGDAWQKLSAAVNDAGLRPTGEERELYLYWESDDSPNNVVQVMMGVR